MGNAAFEIGSALPQVWPAGQTTEKIGHDSILLTRFDDIGAYHPGLMARLFQAEADPTRAKRYAGCGGVKIHSLTQLQCPEAELIDARARFLFRLVSGAPDAVVDISWANIYRQNDYCMPHSHIRSMASVVYMVDEGEADKQDPRSAAGSLLQSQAAIHDVTGLSADAGRVDDHLPEPARALRQSLYRPPAAHHAVLEHQRDGRARRTDDGNGIGAQVAGALAARTVSVTPSLPVISTDVPAGRSGPATGHTESPSRISPRPLLMAVESAPR
jgi:hypothetical protein